MVRRRFGWKEASLPDARSCFGRVPNRGETSLQHWRWRADRGDAVSLVQPPMDRFCTFSFLKKDLGIAVLTRSIPCCLRCVIRHDFEIAASPCAPLLLRQGSKSPRACPETLLTRHRYCLDFLRPALWSAAYHDHLVPKASNHLVALVRLSAKWIEVYH